MRLWISLLTALCLCAMPVMALAQDPPRPYHTDEFRFLYPAEWLLDVSPVQGVIYLNPTEEDDLSLIIVPPAVVDFLVPEARTAQTLLHAFLPDSPVEQTEIADYMIQWASEIVDDRERIIMTTELDEGNLVAMIANVPLGTFADYEERVMQLVASMRLVSAETPALTETYRDLGMRLAFDFPQDWQLEVEPDVGAVYVNNTDTAMDIGERQPGDLSVMVINAEQFGPLGDTAAEVADNMRAILGDVTLSETEVVEVDGKQAYRIDVYAEEADGMMLILEVGDDIIVYLAATIPGEFDLAEDAALGIAATLRPFIGDAWLGG